MKNQYTVEHIGYPTASAIPADAWRTLSTHASLIAAVRAVDRYTAHLTRDQWDDHYRILDPTGNVIPAHLWRLS